MTPVGAAETSDGVDGQDDVRLPAPALAPMGLAALLSAGVGSWALGRPSLWFDEAATISAASRPLGQLWHVVHAVDVVHGFYYLLMHGWVWMFGTSEVGVRSFSVLALAIGAMGMVRIAQLLGGRELTWAVGPVYAVIPGIAWTATEAREWALTIALAVWSTAALLAALRAGGRWRFATYGVLAALLVVTSLMSVLLMLAHAVLIWRWPRRRPAGAIIVAVVVLAVGFALVAFRQRSQVEWISVDAAQVVRDALYNQVFQTKQRVIYDGSVLAGRALLALTVAAAAVGLAAKRRATLVGLIWWLMPTVALAAPTVIGVQYYQERYLSFAAPGVALVVAQGVVVGLEHAQRSTRALAKPAALAVAVVALAALVAASSIALVQQRTVTAKSEDDYRALARFGAGADEVYFTHADSRSIEAAYPEALRGVRDVLLLRGEASDNALWGLNVPTWEAAEKPRGDVLMYVTVDGDTAQVWTRRFEAQHCRPYDRIEASRWIGLRFACPAASTDPAGRTQEPSSAQS